jgi:phosphoglycerate dehydrogenase-like enzyme
MRMLAIRRRAQAAVGQDGIEIHPLSALGTLLPRAHVLLICLPLTPETEGLIGERELALLPSGSLLVNIGRGPIVDEAALFAALASGHLRAAGLDVWYRYPEDEASWTGTFPSQYPFHELDNVVMSPHRGGDNVETESHRLAALAALLNAAACGEPMPNRVDLARGY